MNNKTEMGVFMKIQHFFDRDTFTLTYLVIDESTKDTVIIDPVLDFDPPSGKVKDLSLQEVLSFIKSNSLRVSAILETHAHADHLSSSQILKQCFPEAVLGIGERIKIVQEVFKGHFNLPHLKVDGSQFDHLFKDFEQVNFGSLEMKALPTPGHTPACMTYLFGDAAFTGDALFMPDYGTGRCDFPKGSAHDLYQSVMNTLYKLPNETRVFVGHDYSPNGREMRFQTTIGESKKSNIQLSEFTSEKDYVDFRAARDKTLNAPRLLLPSIQVNIAAGHLPDHEENGKSYLKLPLVTDLRSGNL
jgi:glyoxylase-like metal-dependent hydrolase (beta-lactamase superfamily II)